MKLFVFGSTGDLVKRKVMRALQVLNSDRSVENLEIYAMGRRDMDRKDYHNFICSDWCSSDFKDVLHYLKVDFYDLDFKNFEKNLSKDETNYFYLSLPPSEYKNVLRFIEKVLNENYDVKVLAEKPFGLSLGSAMDLKGFIESSNLRGNFFISDHYVFKKNFSALREIKNFSKVKIVSIEKVGLEGRVSYYDSVGALRDMVQGHFLSLIKKNLNFKIDLGKISVLDFVKGQYSGYSEELGKKSDTETFVYLKFECCGKEFEFITGKGFSEKESFVEVDGKKFEDDFSDNSYVEVFRRFLSEDESLMEGFPAMEDSILGWEVTDKFEQIIREKEMIFYEKGSELKYILKEKNS